MILDGCKVMYQGQENFGKGQKQKLYGKIKGGNGGRESILKSKGGGVLEKTPSSLPNNREKWGSRVILQQNGIKVGYNGTKIKYTPRPSRVVIPFQKYRHRCPLPRRNDIFLYSVVFWPFAAFSFLSYSSINIISYFF